MKKLSKFEQDVAKEEERLADEIARKKDACVAGRLKHNKSRPIEKMKYGVVMEEGAMAGDTVTLIVFPVDGGETEGDDFDYDYMKQQMWEKLYDYIHPGCYEIACKQIRPRPTDGNAKLIKRYHERLNEHADKHANWQVNILMSRVYFVDEIKMAPR